MNFLCNICNGKLEHKDNGDILYCIDCGAGYVFDEGLVLSEKWAIKKINKLQKELKVCSEMNEGLINDNLEVNNELEQSKKTSDSLQILTNEEQNAYNAGHNCGLNEPTAQNCHYSFFKTLETTTAWDHGKRDAESLKLYDKKKLTKISERII